MISILVLVSSCEIGTPPSIFIRNNVYVVGDLVQFWYLIRGKSLVPPCLVRICCVTPLYIISSLSRSFSAFLRCSLMHRG